MTGTDLPVPLRGTRGITPGLIDELLDRALVAVPAPPLQDTSRSAVYQWLREAQEGMASRREQRWLARQVAQVLFDEWTTADWVERTRRMVAHQVEAERQKRAGIYWSGQEARRSAQRPARFRVEDGTWRLLRREADTEVTTLGELLGSLLDREGQRIANGGAPIAVTTGRSDMTERFIRVAIDDTSWNELKHTARATNTTVTAYNSQVISNATAAIGGGRPRR